MLRTASVKHEIDPELKTIVKDIESHLDHASTHKDVTIVLDEQPPDLCRVLCDKDQIEFTLPSRFDHPERRDYFLHGQWLAFATYLVEALQESQSSVAFPQWIDDASRHAGVVYSKTTGLEQTAVPDCIFIRSGGYQQYKETPVLTESEWQSRKNTVFWRGVSTGYRSLERPDWRDLPRFQLCQRARSYQPQDAVDVGITGIVQISDATEIEDIKNSGFMKASVPQDYFSSFKHSIDIDGNSNSFAGFYCKLIFGCAVLKVAGAYSQWYYERMIPWVHFIPVKEDLSDLHERIDWVMANDRAAFEIAREGQNFARGLDYFQERSLMLERLTSRFAISA